MPINKHLAVVAWAVLALLVVSDALFGDSDSAQRFDPAYYASATYAPRVVAASAADDRYFSDDITPSERVKDVFGQISISDSRRIKRYSSLSTIIR